MQPESDAFAEALVVRLFRLWSMARGEGANPLVTMHDAASRFRFPDETASACASLFELVEGHLGRKLERECCCSKVLSPDEVALLGVVRAAPTLSPAYGTVDIPHGLPGAICWAAMAVRRALGIGVTAIRTSESCPFLSRDSRTAGPYAAAITPRPCPS